MGEGAEIRRVLRAEDGTTIVMSPGCMMIFGADNSETRPIRDILAFHGLTGDPRYDFLHDVHRTLKELGDGMIHPDNTAMIEFGYGLDTLPKTIESVTSQMNQFERDIILLLAPAGYETETLIVKTKDGLIFIGPNDGSLGFIAPELIREMRRITGPAELRELTRRVYAAAKITAGNPPLDEFSEKISKYRLVGA